MLFERRQKVFPFLFLLEGSAKLFAHSAFKMHLGDDTEREENKEKEKGKHDFVYKGTKVNDVFVFVLVSVFGSE